MMALIPGKNFSFERLVVNIKQIEVVKRNKQEYLMDNFNNQSERRHRVQHMIFRLSSRCHFEN
jgi:hypothetical protein